MKIPLLALFLSTNALMADNIVYDAIRDNHSTQPSSDAYKKYTAQQKLDEIWGKIQASRYDKLPSFEHFIMEELSLLWPSYNAKAFTHEGDEMLVGRKKLLHRLGTVAKVRFVSTGLHPFTGIFREGSQTAILRLSYAKPPEDKKIFPGMALKFLIDGDNSHNVFAMKSLSGQSTYGFFDNEMNTKLPEPKDLGRVEMHVLGKLNKGARKAGYKGNPFSLNVKNLAAITSSGHKVESPRSPETLSFIPSNYAHDLTQGKLATDDFRSILEGKGEGHVLFHVFGNLSTKDPEYSTTPIVYLGDIVAASPFTASDYGDVGLFFQHPK